MRKFRQNKLWRDKAPKLLEDMGSTIHTKQLSDPEYNDQLRIKLLEEAQEVTAAQSPEELIGEIADVFEVLDSIISFHGLSKKDIQYAQDKKRIERGSFVGRTYVTYSEHPEGSFGEKYCLAAPEKYPEIID